MCEVRIFYADTESWLQTVSELRVLDIVNLTGGVCAIPLRQRDSLAPVQGSVFYSGWIDIGKVPFLSTLFFLHPVPFFL